MPKQSFANKYPNIDRWVYECEGTVEIGYDLESPLTSFVRAIDLGGMIWEGQDDYQSLDEALQDLDAGIEEYLKENS